MHHYRSKHSRMLKKSASGVLASLFGSTYSCTIRLIAAAALLDGRFEHPVGLTH